MTASSEQECHYFVDEAGDLVLFNRRGKIILDDKRFKEYGVYYDDRNPLTVAKIKDSLKG